MDDLTRLRQLDERKLFEMIERLDVRGPRYTSYPTAPAWRNDITPESYRAGLKRLSGEAAPIALYLHLPFCKQRCFYCGCHSFITHDQDRIKDYVAAGKKEIAHLGAIFAGKVRHAWLHLGGGTPTYMPVEELAGLLDALIEAVPGAEVCERSIEVDPRVTTGEQLEMLISRGFRRISIGLQDTDPAVQRAVNRDYPFEDMQRFVEQCRALGFQSVNIDLIYGLPLQTRESWRTTLGKIVELHPDRVAAFGYAHLPDKIKHQRAMNEADMPVPEDRLGMLVDANRVFRANGYCSIGLDHFALEDDRLSVALKNGNLQRNFMGYTDIRGLEMVGVGASSIGEIREMFAQNITSPDDYQAAVDAGLPIVRGHKMTADDRARQAIINNLMCNLVVDVQASPDLSDSENSSLQQAAASLRQYEAEGLVERDGNRWRVTLIGQFFLRNLAMPFDAYLPSQSGVTYSRTV